MKNALERRECKKCEIYENKIFHEIKLFGNFTGKKTFAEMVRKAFRKFRKHLENLLAAEQNCRC